MPEYAYSAYQGPKERVSGRLRAESERDAATVLLGRGLQPIEIKALHAPRSWLLRSVHARRLGGKERALFARQMGDLNQAGMPMLDALLLLESQTDSASLRRAILVIQEAVRDGRSLSAAMALLPRDFSDVHVSLVRAGESAGLLGMVLNQIATLEEKDLELKARIRAALLYPTVTACVGLVTILVILNFVIPRLSAIFEEMGRNLPLVTRALLAVSAAAHHVWFPILPIIIVILLLLRLIPRSKSRRLFKDRLMLRLPGLGKLLLTLQIARFTRVLGSLLKNGVSMLPALTVTTATLDNRALQGKLDAAVARVNQGEKLGTSLEKEAVFPRMITGMILVGESTGNLEPTLERIADSSDRDADRKVKTMVSLLEPGLILVLALFVAFIVAAVIIPIFQVNLAI